MTGTGGGLWANAQKSTGLIENTIFYGNKSLVSGDGTLSKGFAGGAFAQAEPVKIINSTFVGNESAVRSAFTSGWLNGVEHTNVEIRNSLFSENLSTSYPKNCWRTFPTGSGNVQFLVGADESKESLCTENSVKENPMIGGFSDNNGLLPFPVIPLLPTSPARKRATSHCPERDILGNLRGSECSVGAVE